MFWLHSQVGLQFRLYNYYIIIACNVLHVLLFTIHLSHATSPSPITLHPRLWDDSGGPDVRLGAVQERQPQTLTAGHEDEGSGTGRDTGGYPRRAPLYNTLQEKTIDSHSWWI